MSGAGSAEKRPASALEEGVKKKKKKNVVWLVEGVWSEHVGEDGKKYYHDHTRKISVWDNPLEKTTKLDMPIPPKPDPASEVPKTNSAASADIEPSKALKASVAKKMVSQEPIPSGAIPGSLSQASEITAGTSANAPDAENRPADEDEAKADTVIIEEVPKIDLSQLPAPPPEEITKLLKSWVDELTGQTKNAQGFTKGDEVVLSACKELLKSSYSTAKGADLLSSLQVEPGWLTGLMTDAVWRTTLVDLARAAPKEDLFLHAYVVPALASKGYHMDVLDVPNSLSQFFVFQMFVSDVIADFCTKDCHSLDDHLTRSVSVLVRNEFTVLLTLAVLDALGANSNWSPSVSLPVASDGPVTPLGVVKSVAASGSLSSAPGLARWKLCKLREAIENELLSACTAIDTAVLRYTLLSTHACKSLLPAVPAEAVGHFLGAYFRESPIVGVLAPVAATRLPYLTSSFSQHVSALAAYYEPFQRCDASTEGLPNPAHLRLFSLPDRLIRQLFDHTTSLDDKHKADICLLSSLACCVCSSTGPSLSDELSKAAELRSVLSDLAEEIRNESFLIDFSRSFPGSSKLEQTAMRWPCVAAGAFIWMAACVKELQLSRLLHMTRAFVAAHPMLRAVGFALLKDVFLSSADDEYVSSAMSDFRQSAAVVFVEWMTDGFVFPVLEFMHMCHVNPDAPLGSEITVTFLRTLISCVAPPFSAEFRDAMKRFSNLALVAPVIASTMDLRAGMPAILNSS